MLFTSSLVYLNVCFAIALSFPLASFAFKFLSLVLACVKRRQTIGARRRKVDKSAIFGFTFVRMNGNDLHSAMASATREWRAAKKSAKTTIFDSYIFFTSFVQLRLKYSVRLVFMNADINVEVDAYFVASFLLRFTQGKEHERQQQWQRLNNQGISDVLADC